MSSHDHDKRPDETAEPATIYRDADPQGSVASATAAVDTALEQRGSGLAHESGATFHDDATSHAAAEALGANAFTAGSDVYFGAGQFSPGTEQGQALIGHELTHVAQSEGVAPPEPGNFRVSSPSDSAEVEARGGGGGATGTASTIYRDDKGTHAPAGGGAGPAAGGGKGPGASTTDPYEEFKRAINAMNRSDALTKWGSLKTEDKAKVGTEPLLFQKYVVWALHKDAPKVLAAGHVAVDKIAQAILIDDEFEQWLPEMRSNGLLTPFLIAEPKKGLVSKTEAKKLKGWMDATSNVIEAKAVFHKVYPTLLDTATVPASFAKKGAAATAWTQPHITRLYEILSGFLPVGHVQTIQGFYLVTGAGFGWWQPYNYLVALPTNVTAANPNPTGGKDGSVTGGTEGTGHGMTGGGGSGANNTYTAPGGAAGAGANASMGHYTTTVLHEVGHGVGQRMGGNAYALNPASWPAWTPLGADKWANELWAAPTGAGDMSVHENARGIDDGHAKKFMIHEIVHGKNTYTYDPGWFSSAPPRNDVAKWLHSRYSNVPLQKWWDYIVEKGNKHEPSYQWADLSARIKGSWCYGIFTRADQPYSKFNSAAFTQKVSWYGTSSPLEWFAEQYAHYYRTEKTGGGLIHSETKALLDRLDNQAWAPNAADGSTGVQYDTALNRGAAGGGTNAGVGAAGAAATPQGGASARPAEGEQTQPLFFPW
jgi:hypothetical protein